MGTGRDRNTNHEAQAETMNAKDFIDLCVDAIGGPHGIGMQALSNTGRCRYEWSAFDLQMYASPYGELTVEVEFNDGKSILARQRVPPWSYAIKSYYMHGRPTRDQVMKIRLSI